MHPCPMGDGFVNPYKQTISKNNTDHQCIFAETANYYKVLSIFDLEFDNKILSKVNYNNTNTSAE